MGDFVKVVDDGQVYTTYNGKAKEYFNLNHLWKSRHNPQNKRIYQVVYIGKHEYDDDFIYFILDVATKQFYLIGGDGLYKAKQPFIPYLKYFNGKHYGIISLSTDLNSLQQTLSHCLAKYSS